MSSPHRNGAVISDPELDVLKDHSLQDEMRRLAAINEELLKRIQPRSAAETHHDSQHHDGNRNHAADELTSLRRDNAELRARVEALEAVAKASSGDGLWAERQKEYEALLDEKSEVIRGLHLKIQELQDGGAAAAPNSEQDIKDVLAVKAELDEQRRQLEEDEASLMQQMRQMEMAMSKDRAELARQRNDVQRLQAELNREIENASRDPALRDRLVALQKLQNEISGRRQTSPTPPPQARPTLNSKQTAVLPKVSEPEPMPPAKKSSGLFGRLFGK